MGNWAHGEFTFLVSNLPYHYQVYLQFILYQFYDFDANNNEGYYIIHEGQLIVDEPIVNTGTS